MNAPPVSTRLIDRLPKVRGRYSESVALASITWFRVGGNAEVVFRPSDADDLAHFLANKPGDVAVTVLGVASNLLVRDGGVPGVVVRLGRAFSAIHCGREMVTAGAAALDVYVAGAARDAGIGGLEFLSGIPGTIGGALRMNAGAYGRETSDVVLAVTALDGQGRAVELKPADMGFSYRHSGVPADWIFLGAQLQGQTADYDTIQQRMKEIRVARESSQPIRARTGGSTFANPPGVKAWELIERAGCRGLTVGGAKMSERHCNFMINTGNATAADLEALGEEVRRRVKDATGIQLEWEVHRIGVPLAATDAETAA